MVNEIKMKMRDNLKYNTIINFDMQKYSLKYFYYTKKVTNTTISLIWFLLSINVIQFLSIRRQNPIES